MSKVAVAGNASGSGVFTIASPNSNTDRTLTLPDTSGTLAFNPPAFYAYRNGTQAITSSTFTVVQLNATLFDTDSWFDTSTYRYVPQIAGYYQFNACIYIVSASGATRGLISILKNGTDGFRGAYLPPYASTNWAASAGVLIYMNGSTDYVDLSGYQSATSPVIQGTVPGDTFLSGFLVRTA